MKVQHYIPHQVMHQNQPELLNHRACKNSVVLNGWLRNYECFLHEPVRLHWLADQRKIKKRNA